ncbi:hypothetical protein EV06_1472 [Prochlorococcus sp. MIT 0602]|nr:hypothetical protein EV06_1472 [Prochlorococcus sp. MIT 0602]
MPCNGFKQFASFHYQYGFKIKKRLVLLFSPHKPLFNRNVIL